MTEADAGRSLRRRKEGAVMIMRQTMRYRLRLRGGLQAGGRLLRGKGSIGPAILGLIAWDLTDPNGYLRNAAKRVIKKISGVKSITFGGNVPRVETEDTPKEDRLEIEFQERRNDDAKR